MTTPKDPKTKLGAGAIQQPNPEEVNEFHRYDDVDDAPTSHHHTLGRGQSQASPGSHTHDGRDAALIAGENLTSTVPVGTIAMFAGSTAPTNWLLCDGSVKLREEFPDLFAVINVAYGTDTGTDFKVPDLRTRFPVGVGALTPLAAAGGSWDHTHGSADRVLATELDHSHTTDLPSHTHTYDKPTTGTTASTPSGPHDPAAVTSSINDISLTIKEYETPKNPPYLSLNYIIKH